VFKLAKDARILDMLANDPTILPHIAPEGTESLSFRSLFEPDRLGRTRFYHNGSSDADMGATIGMLFDWTSPEVWALHMLAKPEARGGYALRFAATVIADMFEHRAKEIWGETPVKNERARAMHRKVGGISRGFGVNPIMGPVEYFSTPKADWRSPIEPKYSVNEQVWAVLSLQNPTNEFPTRGLSGGLRSAPALNALRTQVEAMPSFLPQAGAMPAPEVAPSFAPIAAQQTQVMPNPEPSYKPRLDPTPQVPDTIRTMVTAPAPVAAPVSTAAPKGAGSFRDFLTNNPDLASGSAASLLSAFQNWSGQSQWAGFTPGGTGYVGSPNTSNAFSTGNGISLAAPQNALQNFYETHGYYPGQGGQ
jgi:hypothetical protein